MFAEQLRRAVEASPRVALAKVAGLLWRAYAAGQVTEAQASELSDLIETKRSIPALSRAREPLHGRRDRRLERGGDGGLEARALHARDRAHGGSGGCRPLDRQAR